MAKVQVLHGVEGARQASGVAVIIDVLRAMSVACYAMDNNPSEVFPVGALSAALQLRESYPDALLIGEREGVRLPAFDFGNSPMEIEHLDFSRRAVIHTTSNGTLGLASATCAEEVLTGSFVNADAIVRYIRRRRPEVVSLVAMGSFGRIAEEDVACAEYLRLTLEGNPPEFSDIKARLRHSPAGRKFFDPGVTWAPERDFELCLTLNRFDFVLRAETDSSDRVVYQKIRVH